MLLGLDQDRHGGVLQAIDRHLLPAILNWISDSDLLHTSLIPAILNSALQILSQ